MYVRPLDSFLSQAQPARRFNANTVQARPRKKKSIPKNQPTTPNDRVRLSGQSLKTSGPRTRVMKPDQTCQERSGRFIAKGATTLKIPETMKYIARIVLTVSSLLCLNIMNPVTPKRMVASK